MAKYFGKYNNSDEVMKAIATDELLKPYVALVNGELDYNTQENIAASNLVMIFETSAPNETQSVFSNYDPSLDWAQISKCWVDYVEKTETDFIDGYQYSFDEAGTHYVIVELAYPTQLNSNICQYTDAIEIRVPAGVTAIKQYAITNNTKLRKVVLPASCVTAETKSLQNNTALVNINLENVEFIGNNALKSCYLASEGIVLNKAATVQYSAFNSCGGLGRITFGDTCTVISLGNGLFGNCSSLRIVQFCDSIASLGSTTAYPTFANCNNLYRVDFGTDITDLGDGAFTGCSILSEIHFASTACPVYGSSTWGDVAATGNIFVPVGASENYAGLISDLADLGKTWTIVEG